MCSSSMRLLVATLCVFLSPAANASDMAGVGLAISLPLSALAFVIASIVSLMSSTNSGYKYIFGSACVAGLIAVVMANHNWKLADDIQMYKWHLILTALMVFPPLILKIRLYRNANT